MISFLVRGNLSNEQLIGLKQKHDSASFVFGNLDEDFVVTMYIVGYTP